MGNHSTLPKYLHPQYPKYIECNHIDWKNSHDNRSDNSNLAQQSGNKDNKITFYFSVLVKEFYQRSHSENSCHLEQFITVVRDNGRRSKLEDQTQDN
jgi:hypothetical protein